MKGKLFIMIALICMMAGTTTTKAQIVEEGNVVVDLYYGWPNLYTTVLKELYADNAVDNSVKIGTLGPLGLRFEYMISDVVGVGLDAGYVNTWVEYEEEDISTSVVYDYKVSVPKIHALFKMNFHFTKSDKVDAYGGFGVGYRNRSFKFTTNDPDFDEGNIDSLIPVGLRISIGTRYYFTENIGIGAEMGLGGPLLSFGISTRF